MKPPRWSERELEMLEQLAGDQPPDRLVWVFNKWARETGHPKRSHQALLTKLSRRGISVRASGDWVSTGYICQVLGVGSDTPQRWSDRYAIPCHRDGRGARFFRRSVLVKVARERPETFAGISADRLFLLLENRQLADQIATAYPHRSMDPRAVCAVETGWTYPSVRAAAARVYVTRQAIQIAIRTGRTAAGYHWKHVQ